MSKVVLVKPLNDLGINPLPLGLLQIGTVLEKRGFKAKIIDCNTTRNYLEALRRELSDALYVGFSCLTTEIASALELSDYVKTVSDVPVVWGGWHPTLFPEQTCADKSVDYVCINEGDETAVQLAETLEANGDLEQINGLASKTRVNKPKSFVNIEQLPLCNYDLVDLSKYNLVTPDGRKTLPYQSSRGCPHRCAFCIQTVTNNNVWRAKSAKKTVDEIEFLIDKYKLHYFGFIDDNFFVNKKRVEEIAREFINRKIDMPWMAECRADYFDRFDEQFLALLARSGLVQVNIGAESGSQRVLNLLNKDITATQVVKSAKLLNDYEIEPVYCFMVGIPTETRGEINSTVKLAEKLRAINPRTQYRMAVLTPYPKCEITDKLIKMGAFEEPASLREWAEPRVRKLYTDRFVGKPWHSNPSLLENLSYFSGLAYETYTDKFISKAIEGFDFRRFPRIILIYLARFRMKLHWYSFPIDKALFMLVKTYFRKRVKTGSV
jgi:anaerobic magnesium-protoporphyrin IX monomethyl ester cyclase